MNYTFPVITHIEQVRDAVKDCPNFIEKNCGAFTIFQYVLNGPETFPEITTEETKIRRECRGITFCNTTGKVISRPFHKFFNYGERAETTDVDLSDAVILEKLDGSMIRPISLFTPEGMFKGFRLGTKMGVTDVAMQAEVFVADKKNYQEFIIAMAFQNVTPIFEWCSRKNKIILDYLEDRLVLLAARLNDTGEYLHLGHLHLWAAQYDLDVVKQITTKDVINDARGLEDEEGYVCVLPDRHMVKVKSEWYVRLHKSKELISREKDVVKMILEGTIDDVKPLLSPEDLSLVVDFEQRFWFGLKNCEENLIDCYKHIVKDLPTPFTRAEFAREVMKSPAGLRPFMFNLVDAKGLIGAMQKAVLQGCSSGPNLEKVRWLFSEERFNESLERKAA